MTFSDKAVVGFGLFFSLFAINILVRALDQKDSVITDQKSTPLLVVSRIHMKSASSMPDTAKVIKFVQSAVHYASKILICVGADEHAQGVNYIEAAKLLLKEKNLDDKVEFMSIYPWGYYVTALNHAIRFAQDNDFNKIAFQSIEFEIDSTTVQLLAKYFNRKTTLVVGPEMEGHEFLEGKNELHGRTTPWNTFAIWDTTALGLIGFPLIGDGVMGNRTIAGVEEVSTISLLQHMNKNYRAYMVRTISRQTWDTDFKGDIERKKYHTHKMETKKLRPAAQLDLLGIPSGVVWHIEDTIY